MDDEARATFERDVVARHRPLHDWVILRLLDLPTMSSGGIALPDTVDRRQGRQARVLACGPGRRCDDGTWRPMAVAPGQLVLLPGVAGAHPFDDRRYVLLQSQEILLVVDA